LVIDAIDPLDTYFERDIFELGHQEFSVVVAILEMRHDGGSNLTRVLIFLEVAIRRAFARRFPAVTIVTVASHSLDRYRQKWPILMVPCQILGRYPNLIAHI